MSTRLQDVRKRFLQRTRWGLLRLLDHLHRALPTRSSSSRVLLNAPNHLMASYVVRAFATLGDNPHCRGYVTRCPNRDQIIKQQVAELGLRWISPALAVLFRWDLIILADHAPYTYAPRVPKLIVPHGPGPSRTVRGGSYYYDPSRALWPDGRRVYDLMLDTSTQAAERGQSWLPIYAGRIRAAGDLLADDLWRAAKEAPRRSPSPPRIAVMSTWGPNGLVERHSHWLFPFIEQHAGIDLEFVITMHGRLWDEKISGKRWKTAIDGLECEAVSVIRPGESWAEPLATTDLAISDHTSLAGSYSILNRPIVPVAVDRGLLVEGTFFSWVYAHVPVVENARDLERALADLGRFERHGAPLVIEALGESRVLTAMAITDVMRGHAMSCRDREGR